MPGSATPQRKRRSKGEQTREIILEGALRLIAREGLRGVTHRAVATEAGVQLSLTTYYFKDIAALIAQAFELFCDRAQPANERILAELAAYLDRYSAAELRKVAVREEIAGFMAREACKVLLDNVINRPEGLAVEQVFFSTLLQAPELRAMAAAHRQSMLTPLTKICRRFNRRDPEVDAELLLDTVTRLEYQALLVDPDDIDNEHIENLLRRQVGWALGLKQA